MFVCNKVRGEKHINVIADEIERADEVLLLVAYVKDVAVEMLFENCNIQGKCVKLICSKTWGSTQSAALVRLCDLNVDVRIFSKGEERGGTFHPKLWLFRKNENWKMLIGSANLTKGGLQSNVEVGVMLSCRYCNQSSIQNALGFFDYLLRKSHKLSWEEALLMDLYQQWRKKAQKDFRHLGKSKVRDLLKFVKKWIDILIEGVRQGTVFLWSEWYIIPNKGYVNNKLVAELVLCLPLIDKKGMSDKGVSQFQEKRLKSQDESYLIEFGWVEEERYNEEMHGNGQWVLTELGRQVDEKKGNIPAIKKLYTEYFDEYSYNGLYVVEFTQRLLDHFDYLTLHEFGYFVTHALSDDEFEWIVDLIRTYRSLADTRTLDAKIKVYFNKVESEENKSAYDDYIEKTKHIMSVIAWCLGLHLSKDFEIWDLNARKRNARKRNAKKRNAD